MPKTHMTCIVIMHTNIPTNIQNKKLYFLVHTLCMYITVKNIIEYIHMRSVEKNRNKGINEAGQCQMMCVNNSYEQLLYFCF